MSLAIPTIDNTNMGFKEIITIDLRHSCSYNNNVKSYLFNVSLCRIIFILFIFWYNLSFLLSDLYQLSSVSLLPSLYYCSSHQQFISFFPTSINQLGVTKCYRQNVGVVYFGSDSFIYFTLSPKILLDLF